MNEKFTKIKNNLIISKMKDLDFRVLCYLIARSKNGQCFPSKSTIAKDLDKSEETIRNSLNRLFKNEFVRKENRILGTGKKTSNLYTINDKYLSVKKRETEELKEPSNVELFDYDWLNDEED